MADSSTIQPLFTWVDHPCGCSTLPEPLGYWLVARADCLIHRPPWDYTDLQAEPGDTLGPILVPTEL